MAKLLAYERQVLREIREWQAETPGWGTRLLARPAGKAAEVVQALIPVSALRAALEGAHRVAQKFSDQKSILKRAGVHQLKDLRALELQQCDRIARSVSRRAMAMAGAGGAAFGVAGAAGLVADVPALITLALRSIVRTGLCYGEDALADPESRLAIGVFALASANTEEEKATAVAALRDYGNGLLDVAWKEGVERAAERELAKEAAVFSAQNLAKKLGVNIGKRKAAEALPIFGALVGGSVNAWYLRDVTRCARYVFQERWLAHKYGTLPEPAKLTAS
jgi:hypothetical protein